MLIAHIFSKQRVLCIFALFVLLFISGVLIGNLALLSSAETSPYNKKAVWVLNIFAVLSVFILFLCYTANGIPICLGLQGEQKTPKVLDPTGIVSHWHIFTPESPETHKISVCGSKKQLEMLNEIIDQAFASGLQEIQNNTPSETNLLDHAAPATICSPIIAQSVLQRPQNSMFLVEQPSGYVSQTSR
ncbi:hypothetical protein [Neorickettsia sennetsu]|uniref:Uncharacterized protein n=1 Tax=Ehrlichia sennetsu (strain ATCC VR-367 / Miyayama) TaxID=222891 RepID=Q2GEQ7_EHRS3|nr:hypothetical protein [Neorickettsia sennetsu]ABD46026.1 hypothetical protein NSE_0140 [Neorickettsia sennetsu str. Miyayama]